MEPIEYMRMTGELYDSLGYPPYEWYRADVLDCGNLELDLPVVR